MDLPTKTELFEQWREAQDDYYPKEMRFQGFYGHEVPTDKILILCSPTYDLTTALNEFIDFTFEDLSEKDKEDLYFDSEEVLKLQREVFNRE